MELKLDKNRRRVSVCPCGKSNKDGKFAPFKNYDNKGYCHACAESFFPDDGTISAAPYKPKDTKFKLVKATKFQDSLDSYDTNNFTSFLTKRFNTNIAKSMIEKYYLGTYGSKIIFWQIDQNFNIRTGKMVDYNRETGKRQGIPSWVHKYLNQSYKACLFGLHLIEDNDKPIALVESEKTADIMGFINPYFNWLATGGISNLNKTLLEPIIDREITLFPDQGAYDIWDKKASEIGLNYKISKECEHWHEDGLIEAKDDIADYYLNNFKLAHDSEYREFKSA